MEFDNIKIADLLKLIKLFNNDEKNNNTNNVVLNKVCIVRTYSAGVHIGIPVWINETTALVKNARRLWKWEGAFTLSEVSINGITGGRISCAVPEILLTQAIEFIPCNDSIIRTFEKCYE